MDFKAVIFDLDGVICHTDEYHYQAWQTISNKLGAPFDRKTNNLLRGVSREQSLEIILKGFKGNLSHEDKQALLKEKNDLYLQFLDSMSPSDVCPEVVRVLKHLSRRGIKIGIGSSSKNARTILTKINILNLFDCISDGNNINNSKPHPEVFLCAADMLGLSPSQCLVVEDAVSGVEAAHAGGFYCAAVGDAATRGTADFVLNSFSDLISTVLPSPVSRHAVTKDGYDIADIAHYGNMFLSCNGYLGLRGTLEEYDKAHMPAVNLAGIYDRASKDAWRESLNAPHPFLVSLCVDGEALALPDSQDKIVRHSQCLQLDSGIVKRSTVFATKKGEVSLETVRFASAACPNVLCLEYRVVPSFDGEVKITASVCGDVWDINGAHYVDFEVKDNCVVGRTRQGVSVSTTVKDSVFGEPTHEKHRADACHAVTELVFSAKKDSAVGFCRVACVQTSVDGQMFSAPRPSAEQLLAREYRDYLAEQLCFFEEFWADSFVQIDGDDQAEQALNFSIFSLFQNAPRHAKALSIPARGLSGQVYKGAIFWDTEMFMLDFFLLGYPSIAKTLLSYRIDGLAFAKEKAAQEGFSGAFYAWEGQENGREACSDFNVTDVFTGRPVRTYFRDKQVHISSAVAYGFYKYLRHTADLSLLTQGGAEVVLECARFYLSLLTKRAFLVDDRSYEILDVVGPDEYHERVNNNAYTNRMAKFCLDFAVEIIEKYIFTKKIEFSAFSTAELARLRSTLKQASEGIYIPSANAEGVIEQFDGYFKLEDTQPAELKKRLRDEREYWGGNHGVAGSTQVLKQADVVAMLALFAEDYDLSLLQRNLDYYEPRTEHGSSLSACMYGLLACFCGKPDEAYPLFLKSAMVDLVKPSKLWAGGIYIGGSHPASWGGAYIMTLFGFAGMRISDGKITFAHRLPSNWKRLRFNYREGGLLKAFDSAEPPKE